MKVLVIGKGGGEHALAHTVNRSGRVKKTHAAPGNPGVAEPAECVNTAGSGVKSLAVSVKEQGVDLTIVGPEAMLSLGIVDAFQAEGLKIFRSIEDAVQMESSKGFVKKIMAKYGIPTTSYQTFDNKADAIGYVEYQGVSIAIEEDGLKVGKGVMVAYELKEVLDATEVAFSVPGNRVVIEEYLEGFEFSLAYFVCDDLALLMEVAQGHKTAYDGDKSPNIGSMGVYPPVKKITPNIIEETMNTAIMSMAKTMVKEGHPFTEFLYGGLMLTKHSVETVEFNVRFDDPEAEIILSGLKTDLCDVIENITNHFKTELEWDDRVTFGVATTSEGYPASSTKDAVIENLENANSVVFHMRTAEKKGSLATGDGRALCVYAAVSTLEEAYEKAYADIHRVHCDELFYRNDIGKKDI